MKRSCAALGLLFMSLSMCAAQSPQGKFQCRRFPLDAASAYPNPVAYIWIRSGDTYDLLDLTTTKGTTSGHYTYDAQKQEIDWVTGDLSKYVGHYLPKIQGMAIVTLNTKKDPRGQIDGTMPCILVGR